MYPWDQAALLANGLTYRPRPLIQGYNAYTPELAELNAAFLRSDRAPDNVLFRVAAMDYHFPALDDGLSWPELLTRVSGAGDGAGVRDFETPGDAARWHLTPLADQPLRFGESVAVPSGTNGPIWAEMDIDPSLAGKLALTFFKPPLLWLKVETRAGGKQRYRLVPEPGPRSGFLLSPVIEDGAAFSRLAAAGAVPAADEVTAISLFGAGNATGTTITCYRSPPAAARLFRLDFPKQDLGGSPAGPR